MGLFGLFFVIFVPMQVVFAIKIKLALRQLRRNDQITEEDALQFYMSIRKVLWVPNSTKYFSRMREAYSYIYGSPLVSFETKVVVYNAMKNRRVKGITMPKQYHKAN